MIVSEKASETQDVLFKVEKLKRIDQLLYEKKQQRVKLFEETGALKEKSVYEELTSKIEPLITEEKYTEEGAAKPDNNINVAANIELEEEINALLDKSSQSSRVELGSVVVEQSEIRFICNLEEIKEKWNAIVRRVDDAQRNTFELREFDAYLNRSNLKLLHCSTKTQETAILLFKDNLKLNQSSYKMIMATTSKLNMEKTAVSMVAYIQSKLEFKDLIVSLFYYEHVLC